ncbi:MAG: extracellular solute-binding protein, partial [Anaerolineae bacterium]|nr:extracellular solute-binding protein [Anaerolineae bacterium]
MKRLMIVLTLVALIATLIACAAPTTAPTVAPTAAPKATAAPQPVTITFYQRGYTAGGTDATSVTTDKAIEIFQKNNPHIKINIVGIPWTAEGDTKLEAALSAKTDINVFRVTSPNLPRYAKQGILSEITPFLTEEDKKDFYESGFQVATVDGKVWAWPLWVTAITNFVNTDILKERGVEPPTMQKPWTWDQFVEACKKLTFKRADGTQVYGFTSSSKWGAVEYYPLMYIDGGRILSPEGVIEVNDPATIEIFDKIASWEGDFVPPDVVNYQEEDARAAV